MYLKIKMKIADILFLSFLSFSPGLSSSLLDINEDDPHSFITWRGETTLPLELSHAKRGMNPWIETISWSPRAFIYHGFLTQDECSHLIQLAVNRLERSKVVAAEGQPDVHEVRTSYSAGLGIGQDPVVARIEDKIAEWTRLPKVK